MAQSEQALKMRFGNINLVDSDIRFHGESLTKLIILGFGGGLAAGALGIGGGAIYTPALLTMGVPPLVTTSTGLHLVLASTMVSSLIYWLNGQLNIQIGIWIAAWAVVGVYIGLRMLQDYIRRTGKHSIAVWVLVWMFIISVLAVPLFGGLSLYTQYTRGVNLWAFRPLCPQAEQDNTPIVPPTPIPVSDYPAEDRIMCMPDANPFETDTYSGYLKVSETKELHYVFTQSFDSPATDPVLIWFNGGPGCSSMFGFLQENGPKKIEDNVVLV